MTNSFVSIVDAASKERQAEMYCELNNWDIPEEMAALKPDWWDDAGPEMRLNIIRPIMNYVQKVVGEKACRRMWWRKHLPERTDEDFEAFWKKEHSHELYRS